MDEAARAEYVERFARQLEAGGQTRIAGRIFAHLATAEEPYLSLQQLADELGVSRASVSTNTRRLMAVRILERVPVPGARGEHYAVTGQGTEALLAMLLEEVRALAALAQEGLDLQDGRVTRGTKALHALRDAYAGIASVIGPLLEKRTIAR